MTRRLEVKVCGLREAPNIAAVGALRPDYMGFIFYPKSPRNCMGMPERLLAAVPQGVETVAVTVDMEAGEVSGLCARYGFTTVQLHGNETPEDCRRLRDERLRIWKAVAAATEADIAGAARYEDAADMLVFDTASAQKGGSGRKFDWGMLEAYKGETPFILSGGIGPDDAEALLKLHHPMLAGVDLNSRFEAAPALKNVGLLRKFIDTLRNYNL